VGAFHREVKMVKVIHNNKEISFTTAEFRKIIMLLKDLSEDESPISKNEKDVCKKLIQGYNEGCSHKVGTVVQDEKNKLYQFVCKLCGLIEDFKL
jgi:hypothetical protein